MVWLPFDYPGCSLPMAITHIFSSFSTDGSVMLNKGMSRPDRDEQNFCSVIMFSK